MKLVQHLLDNKGRNIISIQSDASVRDAIVLMADKGIGSLVVRDDGELKATTAKTAKRDIVGERIQGVLNPKKQQATCLT